MGATSDNYEIITSGTTYTIASDYVNSAHHQLAKIVYGNNDTVTNVSGDTPLPVGICGSWSQYEYLANSGYYSLTTTIVGYTGESISIVGTSGGQLVGITVTPLTVNSTDFDIRTLYGGTVGSGTLTNEDYIKVQGICGGYPVGITMNFTMPVSVSSFSDLGVFGVSGATAIGITVGTISIRGLTAVSDTITVYGGGTAATVSVGLFGFTGATASPIYAEDNALNVNIKTAPGITVSATDLDIRNLSYITDTITVVGQGAQEDSSIATVPTNISVLTNNGSLQRVGGTAGAGWCGAAMNVYLVNSGITFSISASATFSTGIGISQAAYNPVPVAGSTSATTGVWVVGDTANGPVLVQGSSSGYLPVSSPFLNTSTTTINTSIGQVKANTDFMGAMKKALYDPNVSISAGDYPGNLSIYTLVKDQVVGGLAALNAVKLPSSDPSSVSVASQPSLAVSVMAIKPQASFMARTGSATNSPQNLTAFSAASGYTCANGVRIKTSRIATGANASQNEIMCVISEADAGFYGATAGTASYVLYHGDEMFFEVDNINQIKVFYPAYSASFAPHNTGAGMTFSFYAS
jgi:hypothetical protein